MHPLILRVLKKIVSTCKTSKKAVSLCGELAGNPLATPILVGMGMRELSMPPMLIGKIKYLCSQVDLKQCEELSNLALACQTQQQVIDLVKDFYKTHNINTDF